MMLSKRILSDKFLCQKLNLDERLFALPERVIQFGTGVLLRGLPDYFIDQANKKGVFNGRIVAVKSTGSNKDDFDHQDSMFTHFIRGVQNGQPVRDQSVNVSLSRVLFAAQDWHEVLRCAANPEIQLIISNTTEVGISLSRDNVHASPPASFPGKLLAFLYQRYKIFNGNPEKGMVIIPTELIPNNADQLLSILLELAHQNGFESSFLDWLENANEFCNSLVDCIVPGKLSRQEKMEMEESLGYEDELMIMSEPYRLWVIQSSSEKVKRLLSFAEADEGVVVAKDISVFRELKLRLLNGTHTFCCGPAHLAGFKTVRESMQDETFNSFVRGIMGEEIIPAISGGQITTDQAAEFAEKVIGRFDNPFIEHSWLSITLQYSSKMNLRNVATLMKYMEKFGTVPKHMAMALAAHILFMKSEMDGEGNFYGNANGSPYLITDEHAGYYFGKWQRSETGNMVHEILSNEKLWGKDLGALPGLSDMVDIYLDALRKQGMITVMRNAARLNKSI
jgi:tagaturonate reductase